MRSDTHSGVEEACVIESMKRINAASFTSHGCNPASDSDLRKSRWENKLMILKIACELVSDFVSILR